MIRIYIDDDRDPKGVFDAILRSSAEAISYMLSEGCPDYISFDHDLGGDDTAMIVVNWMIETDLEMGNFIPKCFSFGVHSANPVGALNIAKNLTVILTRGDYDPND